MKTLFEYRPSDPITFVDGSKLRKLRLEKDLSLRSFAKLVGVSPTYISLLELSGTPKKISFQLSERIVQALSINPLR